MSGICHRMTIMWRTACGDRVLIGKERSFFVHAAARLLDYLLEDEDDEITGVAQFDRLEPNSRIVLLRDVVQALTDAAIPAPELTALNEAVVHAVFRFIRAEVEMEIGCEGFRRDRGPEPDDSLLGDDSLFWRTLVLTAYLEGSEPVDTRSDDEAKLSPACTDIEEWDLRVGCVADQILWDRDWELEEEIMDVSPEQAQALKRSLGIDEDYFLATIAEPGAGQVDEAMTFLRQLVENEQERA